jgi:hypothetical protein
MNICRRRKGRGVVGELERNEKGIRENEHAKYKANFHQFSGEFSCFC